MSLSDILNSRYSVRAFKKDAVDPAVLQEVFSAAQRAPSNCNVQPWKTYVVSGAKKRSTMRSELSFSQSIIKSAQQQKKGK